MTADKLEQLLKRAGLEIQPVYYATLGGDVTADAGAVYVHGAINIFELAHTITRATGRHEHVCAACQDLFACLCPESDLPRVCLSCCNPIEGL